MPPIERYEKKNTEKQTVESRLIHGNENRIDIKG